MSTDVIITGTGVPNVAPGRAGAGVLVRHADYHADATVLGAMAGRIQMPTLVLTHLIPPPRDEGAIIVARDLTEVSL